MPEAPARLQRHADVELLRLRALLPAPVLKSGARIVAMCTFQIGWLIVSEARLLRGLEGDLRVSLNGHARARLVITDPEVRRAMVSLAAAELGRLTAGLLPDAVSARREGSNAPETIAP